MTKTRQGLQEPLENRGGALYFDGVSAAELAEAFDTPLYVISENRIRDNYRRLRNALTRYYGKVRVYYAAKAENLGNRRRLFGRGQPRRSFHGVNHGFSFGAHLVHGNQRQK